MMIEDHSWWRGLDAAQKQKVQQMSESNRLLYVQGRNQDLTHRQAIDKVFGPPVDGKVA